MIWFLGDSAIESEVSAFAGDEEVFVSAKPEALPADLWTNQIHDARGNHWTPPITAVVYFPDQDYDSELTLWHVAAKIPIGSKIILVVTPNSPKVLEGTDHGVPVSVVEFGPNLSDRLRAA